MADRFKNVMGTVMKERWTRFNLSNVTTDGRLLTGNSKFLAATWNYLNGGIAIFDINNPCEVKSEIPLYHGFQGNVLDIEFSPFRSDLLASGTETSVIKLFQIPEGGLKESTKQEAQLLKGHSKKIPLINFNPVASDCLMSASLDGTAKIWSMVNGEEFSSQALGAIPTSAWWNENGSLIGACCKNKNLVVLDPRQNKSILTTMCHESSKAAKLVWMDSDMLITVGFSKGGNREIKQWDIRKAENNSCTPIATLDIDKNSPLMTPFFDKESKLLYVIGRGESITNIFDFNGPKIRKCFPFDSKEPATAVGFIDRKIVNHDRCELDRIVKFHKNILYNLSFKLARKAEGNDDQLYPPMESGEPAMTFDEWKSGQTKDPIKKKITEISTEFKTGGTAFVQKNNAINENKGSSSGAGKDEEKIKELEAKVKELEEKLAKSEANIQKLNEENEQLKKDIKESAKENDEEIQRNDIEE